MQQKAIFTKGLHVCCHVVLLSYKVRMLCLKPASAHSEINLLYENKQKGSMHFMRWKYESGLQFYCLQVQIISTCGEFCEHAFMSQSM